MTRLSDENIRSIGRDALRGAGWPGGQVGIYPHSNWLLRKAGDVFVGLSAGGKIVTFSMTSAERRLTDDEFSARFVAPALAHLRQQLVG